MNDALTINAANNLAISLNTLGKYEETKSLMRGNITACRRQYGADHIYMLRARGSLAYALLSGGTSSDLQESVAIYEDLDRRARRVLGENHPDCDVFTKNLAAAKRARARAAPSA